MVVSEAGCLCLVNYIFLFGNIKKILESKNNKRHLLVFIYFSLKMKTVPKVSYKSLADIENEVRPIL